MKSEIRKIWRFDQSPEEVWEYLTRAELIEQWLGKTDFEPVVGHKFRFASPHGNDAYCEVLEIEPFTNLSYSWQKKSLENNKSYNSKVEWTLSPRGTGTELLLVHNGFVAVEDLSGHDSGWDVCLKTMNELINAKRL